jgi:Holliday junction DNA helicase RuvA
MAAMISRIEGELVSVEDGRAELRCGHLTYLLLIPTANEDALGARIGQQVNMHTLHYMEGQGQGSSFIPRLIGFASAEGRAFFELLTTVKGLGARKALRALSLPYTSIAQAIACKDADLLTSLPEIGTRTAATIVAELHGKVDRFLDHVPSAAAGGEVAPVAGSVWSITRDAVAAMTQLGEPKLHARQLVDRALSEDPTLDSADALVAAAYRGRIDDTPGASE